LSELSDKFRKYSTLVRKFTNMKKFIYLAPLLFIGCQNESSKNYLSYKFFELDQNISNGEVSEYTGELPNDPIYKYQWHLEKLEVQDVWEKYRGKGISIGVVDTGIEAKHPDLIDKIDFNNSLRYSDGSNNPSPDENQLSDTPSDSAHGTACAGIIGAEGWNEEGVVGVAPESKLVGFNAFSSGYNSDFEDALGNLNVDISSNSWGASDSNALYDDPASMRGIEHGIKNGRDGKGIIYVFASGNEGNNINSSTLHGSRYVFNVGAVIKSDEIPDYSNFGENLLLVAPAGDWDTENGNGIYTTDLTGWEYGFDMNTSFLEYHTIGLEKFDGNYTGNMNGTSSAVPVVSGAIALVLEANPDLTYRDLKYILSKTATVKNSDVFYYDWIQNGAGIWHSPYYGFGIINLKGAIELAENFTNLSEEQELSAQKSVDLELERYRTASTEIEVSKNMIIEHIELVLDVTHYDVGALRISLSSPSGTKSVLTDGDRYLSGTYEGGWSLNSLKFLDENSSGTWKISIYNKSRSLGTFNSFKLNIYGR
jgi:subtilisin family serine protease